MRTSYKPIAVAVLISTLYIGACHSTSKQEATWQQTVNKAFVQTAQNTATFTINEKPVLFKVDATPDRTILTPLDTLTWEGMLNSSYGFTAVGMLKLSIVFEKGYSPYILVESGYTSTMGRFDTNKVVIRDSKDNAFNLTLSEGVPSKYGNDTAYHDGKAYTHEFYYYALSNEEVEKLEKITLSSDLDIAFHGDRDITYYFKDSNKARNMIINTVAVFNKIKGNFSNYHPGNTQSVLRNLPEITGK